MQGSTISKKDKDVKKKNEVSMRDEDFDDNKRKGKKKVKTEMK